MTEQRKKSILCPRCRKLVSSDEEYCPYCGMSRPGSWWKGSLSRFYSNPQDLVRSIIWLNAALFIFSILLFPTRIGFSANPFAFLSPSDESLFVLGATGTIPIGIFRRWWTLVSANFLHGSILHIFFNMAALRQLGPFVAAEYGASRFLSIYILSGVAGFLVSYVAGIPFTIGASASLTGLIGAILYYGKSRGGIYGQAIYKQATGWVIGIAVIGLLVPAINNWAHGGGLACGLLIGWLLGYEEKRPETSFHRGLGAFLVFITAAILVWAVFQSLFLRFIRM
ncbi:MAG: rhomboid family intramembrane serine protease [Syntrophales bacterium]